MSQRRNLDRAGGCVRKTVSLSADVTDRVEAYLASPRGEGLTFSSFVSDSLKIALGRVEQLSNKKKVL